MIGATLYLVGKDMATGELVQQADSCSMCKRVIINAGIEEVIIRETIDSYKVIEVQSWIDKDDSLSGILGY